MYMKTNTLELLSNILLAVLIIFLALIILFIIGFLFAKLIDNAKKSNHLVMLITSFIFGALAIGLTVSSFYLPDTNHGAVLINVPVGFICTLISGITLIWSQYSPYD